jgi:C4-dicarboxylate-specific signal transduction histidine kinase
MEDLDDIVAQGQRAGEIIHRLRNFVRKRETRQVQVDANSIVRDVIGLLSAELRLSEVELQLDLDRALPEVMVDTIQIEQVLVNLVRNALDAMAGQPPERRQLSISTTREASQWLLVAVRDSGTGIAQEHVGRVCDPFFTTKADGMGLGLSISHSILEAHGGRLWAEPRSSGGTVFRFTLPIATEEKNRDI